MAPLDVEIRYTAFKAFGHECFIYTTDTNGRLLEAFRPIAELLEALQYVGNDWIQLHCGKIQ